VQRIDAWGPDPLPEECTDESEHCADWASQGECENNPGFMHESCKKSCKICTVGESEVISGESLEGGEDAASTQTASTPS
jgi:hypothetical protein